MTKTPCISCKVLNLRADESMAKQGRGECRAKAVGVFVHIERNVLCRDFRPLEAQAVEARSLWWARNSAK